MHLQCHTSRCIGLRKLILVQERRVKARVDGYPVFERLGTLKVSLHED
jgi:hypothetical protein